MLFTSDCLQRVAQNIARRMRATLHCRVTSKKGVIGFGSPTHSLRRKPQSLPQSTCGLFVRASFLWWLGQGAARLAGSRKRVSGLPTCSSCRPHLEVGAVVFANHTRLEAFMADRIPARALAARTSSPTSGTPDPIQLHAAAHNALGTALHHLRQPHVDAARARRKVMQALAALRGLDVALSLEG